jgi:type I restriction enzyme S subunit
MTSAEDTNLPFQFPNDWQTSYVGDEFFLILGKMLDAEKNVGVSRPYLGNKSVQWGYIDTEDLSLIKLTPGDLRRYRLMDGDLLVCEGGDIGRSAIWRGQLEECYFQKALHRVRPRGEFSPVLLRYLLEYYSKTGFLLNFATQTSIAHLPKEKFEVLPLPKPPMVEQGAIAEALSDADALIEGLERLTAKKRLIKQGVMQDLLTAKRRLPGFSGEWVETTFGQCFQFLRTGSASRSQLGTNLGVGYIHYGDIHGMKSTILDLSRTQLPEIVPARAVTLSRVQDGDLVIADASEDVMDVGKSVEVRGAGGADIVAGLHTFLLRGKSEIVADGFKAYIQFLRDVRAGIESIATGSSVYGISKKNLAGLKFRVPPVKEQAAIGQLFADMDAEIHALEIRVEKARAVKEGMIQILLTGRIRLV